MIVARSAWQLRRAIDKAVNDAVSGPIVDVARERPRIAFIPTMGALHEGHISLVRSAVADANPITVASVFVNPTQFGDGEDFSNYPRTEEADLELLESAGLDVAFIPSVDDVYPEDFATEVKADRSLCECLCGASRGASHFDGVVTVVARLFGLVQPDTAWFGEKDWQQLQIIRRMAADIYPGVEIMPSSTVRAEDGLALSSRNAYLSEQARSKASAVPQSVAAARKELLLSGDVAKALETGVSVLTESGFGVDYFELRSAQGLRPVVEFNPDSEDLPNHPRIFVAATLDGVRLIDNEAVSTEASTRSKMALTSL